MENFEKRVKTVIEATFKNNFDDFKNKISSQLQVNKNSIDSFIPKLDRKSSNYSEDKYGKLKNKIDEEKIESADSKRQVEDICEKLHLKLIEKVF